MPPFLYQLARTDGSKPRHGSCRSSKFCRNNARNVDLSADYVRATPDAVAILKDGYRDAEIESKSRAPWLILAEAGAAPNQNCANSPSTEFCNNIPQEADHSATCRASLSLTPDRVKRGCRILLRNNRIRSMAGLSIAKSARRRREIAMRTAGSGSDSTSTSMFAILRQPCGVIRGIPVEVPKGVAGHRALTPANFEHSMIAGKGR